ncbi:MAG TPA: NAD(P)H-dependent oxidoreductase subunit E [Bacteroidetes bacterium]|nr:NAD(P)H-dependent oxidoreductase subunit E [Bacteroidota bacterium]
MTKTAKVSRKAAGKGSRARRKKASSPESGENGRFLAELFERYPREETSLIMVLQDVQDHFNWLPPEALDRVAVELGVPRGRVQSVATFYRAFSLSPRGSTIVKVCLGTACHVRGSSKIAEALEKDLGIEAGSGMTEDGKVSIETVNCLGACAMAPVVVIGDRYHANALPEKIVELVKKERES